MNKKISIGILVVVLALILAFCAIPRDDATKPAENTTVPAAETASLPTEATTAPTEYTLPEGEGFEYDATEDSTATIPTESSAQPTEGKDNPAETEPVSDKGTEPAETTAPTEPAETTAPTEPDDSGSEYCNCAYAQYLAMSPASQQAYMDSFDSPMAFIDWCRAAEKEHEGHNTAIEVEGGDLNVGDFIG